MIKFIKRLTAIILCLACSFSVLPFVACDKNSCEHSLSREYDYTLQEGDIVNISRRCEKCNEFQTVEEVKADVILENGDGNELTKAYVKSRKDLVVFAKAGFYEKIFIGYAHGAVRVLCEKGTQVRIAQANGGFDSMSIENAIFKSDPKTETASNFKFEVAGGTSYWSNVTIKNCHFEGKSYINRAWSNGVVDNLTVENCTFKDITDNYDGLQVGTQYTAIFIDESWGNTLIKDCIFENFEYSAIRLGTRSNEGTTIVENCQFINGPLRLDGAAIYFTIKNTKLENVEVSLIINDCVFDCDVTLRWLHETSEIFPRLVLGTNKWKEIPDWIEDFATEYDMNEQILINNK